MMRSIRALICGAAAAIGMLAAADAGAAITVSATAANGYGYLFGSGAPDLGPGGEREQVFQSYGSGGLNSALGVDYVGQANANSFFFLHDDYCVGLCSTGSRTAITLTITNDSTDIVPLRFDSQITPGHLARLGNDPNMSAGFDFSIRQGPAGAATTLYSATGYVDSRRLEVVTSDGVPLNKELRFTNGAGAEVLDWSATNLSVELGRLLPGQSTTLTYSADYRVTSFGHCVDLSTGCTGAQVVFGDPRHDGSGAEEFLRALVLRSAAVGGSPPDFINREYVPYEVPFAVVLSGSPLPAQPTPEPRFRYGADFTVPGVPEPATWASLVAGLALVGGTLRRARALPA